VRIGTRITLTTSALVAVILGVYGYVTLRTRRAERENQLERQARELASTVRGLIETGGRADANGEPLLPPAAWQELTRAAAKAAPWRVEYVPGTPSGMPPGDPEIDRFRRMVALRGAVVEKTVTGGHETYVLLEPVREPLVPIPITADDYRIIGAVRVSRDIGALGSGLDDEATTIITSMILLVGVLILAISISTRRGIGVPVAKLIAGIDDVAKGDLSHVVLQERDDEIGALAARFNDMTQSLRDARAEAEKGVEERLKLEAHLRNATQLATIGQLAAEIAHEVGTPLNVVTGRARSMAKKADDPDAVQKNATIIAEQAQRITRIIQRLLDVARRKVGDAEKGSVDLNKLAGDTLELLEHQIANARIDARARTGSQVAPIPGDRDQLQQVLLNLYMNAIQAMPDGGRLEVKTSRVVRRRPGLELAAEHDYVVLEVSDTGVGIPEEHRAKIFEAFYTSKADAGGTGLGLAVAHGIVKDHDGWIELDGNPPGNGTTFRVYLPATPAVEARAS
jgi:signal transduction histidine kinase